MENSLKFLILETPKLNKNYKLSNIPTPIYLYIIVIIAAGSSCVRCKALRHQLKR